MSQSKQSPSAQPQLPRTDFLEEGGSTDPSSLQFTFDSQDRNYDNAFLVVKCLAAEDDEIILEVGSMVQISTVGINTTGMILDDIILA